MAEHKHKIELKPVLKILGLLVLGVIIGALPSILSKPDIQSITTPAAVAILVWASIKSTNINLGIFGHHHDHK